MNRGCGGWVQSYGLNFADLFAQRFFRLARALLQPSEEFLLLALCKKKIVVGQAGVFLFQLAGDFVPSAFEGEFGYGDRCIGGGRGSGWVHSRVW